MSFFDNTYLSYKLRFIALKMPKIKGYESVHADIASGLAFYYADSNNQVLLINALKF